MIECMKKLAVAVICLLMLCSLLAVMLVSRPASPILPPASQATPQSLPQDTLPPPSQTTPETTPQNTPSRTVQPTPQQSWPATPQTPPQPSSQPTAPIVPRPGNRTLQEAVGNATKYFARATMEPYALLMLNVLYRRFGIPEFADSLQRYDEILGKNPENAPLLRVFRRIADYGNTWEPSDFYSVRADVDQITVPALYSDRFSLADDYMAKLNDAGVRGGYLLTHALLATVWLQENNRGQSAVPDDLAQFLYRANAGLMGNGSGVNDVEVEAAAFLYLAGQGTLVSDAFVQRVISAQNYDGGWSYSSDMLDVSDWHPSVLALMLLLHVEFPSTSYPPTLAPAPGYAVGSFSPMMVSTVAVLLLVAVNVGKKTVQQTLTQRNRL